MLGDRTRLVCQMKKEQVVQAEWNWSKCEEKEGRELRLTTHEGSEGHLTPLTLACKECVCCSVWAPGSLCLLAPSVLCGSAKQAWSTDHQKCRTCGPLRIRTWILTRSLADSYSHLYHEVHCAAWHFIHYGWHRNTQRNLGGHWRWSATL